MKTRIFRPIAVALLALFFVQSSFATCGGGGGGGGGGMSNNGGGGGSNAPVYVVPWKTASTAPSAGLVLYWFPASQKEIDNSSLKQSRILSLYASQCVAMQVANTEYPTAAKLISGSTLPVAVLAKPDGTPINKVENTGGKLKVADVEKLVDSEMKTRKSAISGQMKDAADKVKAGDKDAAIAIYKEVAEQKCLFKKEANDASKELKKLGVAEIGAIQTIREPIFERRQSARIEAIMKRGLIAENNARYPLATKFYMQAHLIDPADPTPLRYLGENYRHNIGAWDKARDVFNQILDMPSDPLSRSVALHGLGKMTIHDGEFKKGLALMERAVEEFPLALAYRNLAVYWNSENDPVKGNEYTQKALALDPKDPYNLVFAAVFMAANGKKDEALKIARANMNLMPASYNLAAIFAQNGQKEKALQFLRRHFYQYERYNSVRAKEMMEARVDAVFESIRTDREFVALTKNADGRLPIPMKGMPATMATPNR
ncbi:MAG TPA: tetratricopeptide repeat protein [Pyrinomonadaceae bacterium]|nr:tetratricopeptide repeat protein [Pyrinomonadaceae bacterium]